MALTTLQYQSLKAAIIADGALSAQPNNSDGAFAIAAALNQVASPAWVVWRTDVSTADCKKATVWTEYIGRSAGERDAWVFMLSNGIINPSQANIRQGINDIFSGVGGAASRTALLAIAKMNATRAQKIFSTGTGTDVTPATLDANISESFQLSYADVEIARQS